MADNELTTDILFVALTRPATILGIPYMAFVIEFMAVAVFFVQIGDPLYFLVAIPIHGILYLISATDPGRFGSIYIWIITKGKCQNTKFWNAVSFSPQSK